MSLDIWVVKCQNGLKDGMNHVIYSFEYIDSELSAHFLYLVHKLSIIGGFIVHEVRVYFREYLLKELEYLPNRMPSLFQMLTNLINQALVEICDLALCACCLHRLYPNGQLIVRGAIRHRLVILLSDRASAQIALLLVEHQGAGVVGRLGHRLTRLSLEARRQVIRRVRL